MITTTFVFDEVVTFFNSRGRHNKAVEIGNRLRESPSVDMIQVDQQLLDEDWKFFTTHSDKKFSLTDCISFVVMANRKVTSALTFDKHFEQAGFQKLP